MKKIVWINLIYIKTIFKTCTALKMFWKFWLHVMICPMIYNFMNSIDIMYLSGVHVELCRLWQRIGWGTRAVGRWSPVPRRPYYVQHITQNTNYGVGNKSFHLKCRIPTWVSRCSTRRSPSPCSSGSWCPARGPPASTWWDLCRIIHTKYPFNCIIN